MKKLIFTLSLLPLLAGSALARQAAEPPVEAEKIEEVKVATTRDPEFKFYRPFILGLDAFARHRQFAPEAPLRFILRADTAPHSFEGVSMRIAGNDSSVDIPIAADGTFTMPREQALADENAEIILNRKKGTFRWRPYIHTPGLPPDVRRLGDLRLECELRWAVERSELGFIKRTSISALGGACQSKHVQVLSQAPRQIKAAYMMVKGARVELDPKLIERTKGRAFTVPIFDHTIPDDTLVQFEFAEPSKT